MKISVDGGALNQKNDKRFGTAVFSENLVKALKLYDKKNQYHIYTFENLKPKFLWMKCWVSIEEFRKQSDIFLGLNQALPIYTNGKIISFCHGLSYHFFPKFYSKSDTIRLNSQLKEIVKRSDKIIVSSQKVKDEIVSIYQYIKTKVVIIPFGVPLDMSDKKTINNKSKYFLFVGNNQPIKNVDFIIRSFGELRQDPKYLDYKLYLVGGWKKIEDKNRGILSFGNISRAKLKTLYRNATSLLTASNYESFNFPVLEALSQGCPVIGLKSAIIPELKDYVNLADNQAEFITKIKKINIKPTVQSIKRLYNQFNWKNYVQNLVRLY